MKSTAPQSIDELDDRDVAPLLRRALLALVFLGAAGLGLELLLLDHFESAWQWTPLVLLALVILACAPLIRRPSAAMVRIFRALMVLCVAAGLVGIYLHYAGNAEFELEREPLLSGVALFWESIRGATPALAPAAMSQVGLLGLMYTFRHPALRRPSPAPSSGADVTSPETS